MLARKNREEISIFFWGGEKNWNFWPNHLPFTNYLPNQYSSQRERIHSTETRVKLAVANFLDDFFLSYKTVAGILSDPSAENYVILDAKLIYNSLMLQILG